MTGRIVLPGEPRRQIIDHCVAALPNEGCGLLAIDDDRVMNVYPTENHDSSPISYTIPPQEHYDAVMDAESRGWEICGVFHSHPRGPAEMSRTDLGRALRPGWTYLVIALDGAEPVINGWRDGELVEVDIR